MNGIKFKIESENKGRIKLIKTLCESLKTAISHFEDGWRYEVVKQISLVISSKLFSESSVHWNVILLFLIDICVILFVNVHPVFILNGRLTLITLKETTPPL